MLDDMHLILVFCEHRISVTSPQPLILSHPLTQIHILECYTIIISSIEFLSFLSKMLEEKFVTLLSVTKLLYIFFSNLAVWLTVDCSVYEARSVFLGHKVGEGVK